MTIATAPLTILADDREKAAYSFTGLGEVHVVRRRLVTGDYSLPLAEDQVAVSRKSLEDLYATALTPGRRRLFEAELLRMSVMPCAAVVVEGEPLTDEPPRGGRQARAVVNQVLSRWRRRHPAVGWLTVAGRRGAEAATFAWLLSARERLLREAEAADV